MELLISKTDEQKLVSTLKDKFQSALDHPAWRAWRKEATKNFAYRDGEHWSSAELKILAERGQAPTVNNQVKVFMDYLLGQVLKVKTKIRFRGTNVPEDQDLGDLLTELRLYTDQVNKYKYQEDDRNNDTACSGFGVSKMVPFYNETLDQPDIKITTPDCLDIYPDPYSTQYDWSDCQFVCEAPWVDVKEAQALYPKFKVLLEGMINNYSGQTDANVDAAKGNTYIDQNRKRLRVVEIWWIEVETKNYVLVANKPAIDVSDWGEERISKKIKKVKGVLSRETKKEINMAVFVDNLLLEYRKNPFNVDMLPYIPQFARRKKNGQPFSFVSLILPLQDSINKRESKALHILNANQVIYEDGAVLDEVEEAKNRARPDGVIKLAKNALAKGQYVIVKNTELAATQMSFHQQNLIDIRRVAGFNPDALGEKSEVRSGVGIARKQQASQMVIAKFIENGSRTKANEARLWLKYVQEFYKAPMIFYITGDVTNNFKRSTRMLNIKDEQSGNIVNQVAIGAYEVVIEEMRDTDTMHQVQFEMLAKTLPQIASFGPGWGKLLVSFSDLPGKQEILEQFDKLTKKPPEVPKITLNIKWEDASPEDKKFFRQLMGVQTPKQIQGNVNQVNAGVPRG